MCSELIEDVIRISEGLPKVEGIGHLARANKKLTQMMGDFGKERESHEYLEKALSLKEDFENLHSHCAPSDKISSDFEGLVPWMLW